MQVGLGQCCDWCWSDCSWRRDLFFFLTQNQRDWYKALDGLYTPAAIFFLNMSIKLSRMPVGIGIFLWIQGVWAMVGILTGKM